MTVASSTLPITAGTYPVDINHSGIHFQIRHLGLSNVRGRFKAFDARLTVGDTLEDTAVEAAVDLASLDTSQADRDAHLLGTDFFHADLHPQMTFRSTAVRAGRGDRYELIGDLTLNGITAPVTFDVDFEGESVSPADGKVHVGFSGVGEIKRGDFGIDFNMPLGVDKLALGEKVKVDLDIQFLAP